MNRISNSIRKVNGKPFKTIHNPGVVLEPDFVTADEEKLLMKETLLLKEKYSFSASSIHLEAKNSSTKRLVHAHRVTGRPELDHQIKAPWFYGDRFHRSALDSYPAISKLATKIESIMKNDNEVPVELRDITINYRSNAMFMLDPHIDPHDDGRHVFILGLQSATVLTLTPDINLLMKNPAIFKNHIEPPMKMRNQIDAISALSWTDIDIDILMNKRSLLHLKNDARYSFKHAIRAGVEVDSAALPDDEDHKRFKEQHTVICDWFGSMNDLIPRDQERTSIILAFK